MSVEFILQCVVLFFGLSGAFWKIHFSQKSLKTVTDLQDDKILNLEKQFCNSDKKLTRKLSRIEKILIRMDERMQTRAADELISDDD